MSSKQSKDKTSAGLRREIEKLAARREELGSELQEAEQLHSQAQERLLARDPTMVAEKVALHFSTVASMQKSIATIDERVGQLRQQLAEIQAAEALAEAERRLPECEHEREAAHQAYRQARVAVNEVMEKQLPIAVQSWQRYRQLRQEYYQLLRMLGRSDEIPRVDRLPYVELLPFGPWIDAAAQAASSMSLKERTEEERIAQKRERWERDQEHKKARAAQVEHDRQRELERQQLWHERRGQQLIHPVQLSAGWQNPEAEQHDGRRMNEEGL